MAAIGGNDREQVSPARAEGGLLVDASLVVEIVGVEARGRLDDGAADVEAVGGLSWGRLAEPIVHEGEGGVVAWFLLAVGKAQVRRVVMHVPGAEPQQGCGGGRSLVASFFNDKEFVSMRDGAETGVIALNFSRATGWIGAALEAGFQIGVLRPVDAEVGAGRGEREVGHADLVGQNSIDALRASAGVASDKEADEVETVGGLAGLHLDAVLAELLVEVEIP